MVKATQKTKDNIIKSTQKKYPNPKNECEQRLEITKEIIFFTKTASVEENITENG